MIRWLDSEFGGAKEMRGKDESSGSLLSYIDLEPRVTQDHPLRAIPGADLYQHLPASPT